MPVSSVLCHLLHHGWFPVNIRTFIDFHGDCFKIRAVDVMASGSTLGVDIISDSSTSSTETDSDFDGNVRFSEFDSDSGSDDDGVDLGFGESSDTPVRVFPRNNKVWAHGPMSLKFDGPFL